MAAEILRFIHLWYENQEFGRVMAVTTKFQGSSTGQWLNLSRASCGSGTRAKKHIDICNVGAGDWLVRNFEPNADCGSVNCQTQHRTNLMQQPAQVTRIISIITSRGGKVPESYHHSSVSVVATLVLPAHQMAKKPSVN